MLRQPLTSPTRSSLPTCCTYIAEKPEDINLDRVQLAKERAEERLRSKSPDIDYMRAELALRRALVRLNVASKTH